MFLWELGVARGFETCVPGRGLEGVPELTGCFRV